MHIVTAMIFSNFYFNFGYEELYQGCTIGVFVGRQVESVETLKVSHLRHTEKTKNIDGPAQNHARFTDVRCVEI